MRIGVSTSVIQRGRTGIAQHVFALLRALQRCQGKHQFVLFVLEEDLPFFEFARSSMDLVRVDERHRPSVKNILWHQTGLLRLARRHQLDLLHVPSYRRLVWSRHIPTVGTIHDLAPFRVAHKYDRARMFYGRVVARQLARRQRRLIAISQNTATDLVELFGISRSRIRVVHNGLEHDRFRPVPDADEWKPGLDKPFLLYVARLEHPGKNHVRLIEAYEQFKQRSGSDWLLVFGGSDWHGAGVIHERVARSPWRHDIRNLGFVEDAKLPALYRAATGFIYPSLYEGFGLPPVEAMACGCPVISSERGSLGEVIGDAALVVDPEEVNSMTEAMVWLASDEGLRASLHEKGLRQAARFDWDKTAAATLEVYEEALRGGGGDEGLLR